MAGGIPARKSFLSVHYNVEDVYAAAELGQEYYSNALMDHQVEYLFPSMILKSVILVFLPAAELVTTSQYPICRDWLPLQVQR